MALGPPKYYKTLWEKEKLLVTSDFSFSHSVFKRLVPQTHKKPGLVWERVKRFSKLNPLLHKILILTHQQQIAFENIVGKRRNCS